MVSRSRPTTRSRGALPTSLTPAFSRSPAEMATSRIWPRRVSSRPASGPTTILTNFGPAMATNHSRSCRTSDSHRICHNRRSQRNRDSYRTHRRHQGHRIRHSRRSNRENISGDTACDRSEEHTSELQSPCNLVCRLLLEKKKKNLKASCCQERNKKKKSKETR